MQTHFLVWGATQSCSSCAAGDIARVQTSMRTTASTILRLVRGSQALEAAHSTPWSCATRSCGGATLLGSNTSATVQTNSSAGASWSCASVSPSSAAPSIPPLRNLSTSAACQHAAASQPATRPQKPGPQSQRSAGRPKQPAQQPDAPSSPTPAPSSSAGATQPDMEQLAQALIQPLPLGRSTALLNHAVQVNRTLFLDPAKTLESTMRALYVVRRVLQDDGHIVLLNSNPMLQPLLREAALCCINSNLWFMDQPWTADTLADASTGKTLFQPEHQPNRQLLAAKGISMVNPHCMQPDVMDRPAPKLHMMDKWQLMARRGTRDRRSSAQLLHQVVALEQQVTKLPVPNMLAGEASKLRLLVTLDLTHDLTAVEQAFERSVMTVSLVNAHSDLSRITYPVYAGENHLRFQHFLLDWIIKVANMPTPLAAA